ncbi:FCD domain-containing protein [Acuticoccus sp. MNP-M23]|uniref:FadR/GntR family transcriptional regulator n=1 Tax=Acuticoccus sp. MNP-M23 TaxID=3072793 RepID=UPI0028159076|nr:FCD domain-containing protein [Acuticoccus sp. MNP-M23]WMS41638.1 FCD domain-containing protein [Acuticoccus sp. MNP-M23]
MASRALGERDGSITALRDFLAASDLAVGAQLPGERRLMAELSVGRSSLREAIGRLAAVGVLEVRHGSGTYLRRPITQHTLVMPLAIEAERDDFLRLVEVRRGLEAEAAALASERASASTIAGIEDKLTTMEAAFHAQGTAGPEDLAFHLSIYAASGNPLFGQFLELMRGALDELFAKPFNREDFARRSFPMHRTLFEAIARRDADDARRQTHLILDIVREDLIEMALVALPDASRPEAAQ